MSPRAAWQLEAFGFERVHDFVEGKVEWLARGLPTEGKGPHHAVAGEIARFDVPACRLGDTASDIEHTIQGSAESFCVVLNDTGILLGRVRRRELPADRSRRVETFLNWGPATVRPTEALKPLVERMRRAGVGTILVTTKKGQLVGVVHRDEAERHLERHPIPSG
jgi:Mg/Co/Ni transporter MgtE